MRFKSLLAMVAVVALFSAMLMACNGEEEPEPTPTPPPEDPTPTPPPDDDPAAQGELIFAEAQPSCAQCHTIGGGDAVGPDLEGIATRAADRVDGLSAEEYLRQAIVDPEAYVVEGFQTGIMPDVYEDQLSEEELDALVAYLMTLE